MSAKLRARGLGCRPNIRLSCVNAYHETGFIRVTKRQSAVAGADFEDVCIAKIYSLENCARLNAGGIDFGWHDWK